MNSNINPEYYYSPEIFNIEKEKIFSNNVWHFSAFMYDLQNENDFVTLKINEIPIVIQKLKGEIKAFINICSHRFSILQKERKGNRPLLCPYHGWSYNFEGIPNGIPKKPLFKDYSKEELCEMKLEEFKVEICGSLVFISLDNNSMDLKEYLGKFYNEIELMSNEFGEQIDCNPLHIKSNWKVIIENTMEGYHLGMVHKETLAQLMPLTSMKNLQFDFCYPHSNYIIPLLIDEESKKLEFVHKPFKNRKWKINGFIHYLIFPNLLISSSYGTTFNVSIINPIDADNTNFESNVFLAKLDEGYEKRHVQALINTAVDYNRKVFLEDKEICELVQIGVKHTKQKGQLSLEEKRVEKFQADYLFKMNK